jgi:hypothetical protein
LKGKKTFPVLPQKTQKKKKNKNKPLFIKTTPLALTTKNKKFYTKNGSSQSFLDF